MPIETRYVEQVVRTCGHCHQPFQQGEAYHESCAREYKIREAMMFQERQEKSDVERWGEKLNSTERFARNNPNMIAAGYNESYNQRLARQAQEKQQEYYKKLADRESRKKQLPNLEYQLKYLRAAIQQDEIEEK